MKQNTTTINNANTINKTKTKKSKDAAQTGTILPGIWGSKSYCTAYCKAMRNQYEQYLGITLKTIPFTDYHDIPCLDQERVEEFVNQINNGSSAYNSASATIWFDSNDCEIGVCEGLIIRNHCWNYILDKKTNTKYYVDFTLNGKFDCGILVSEWTKDDILNLFDACRYAFIPFSDYYLYVHKKQEALINNHYPHLNLESICFHVKKS